METCLHDYSGQIRMIVAHLDEAMDESPEELADAVRRVMGSMILLAAQMYRKGDEISHLL